MDEIKEERKKDWQVLEEVLRKYVYSRDWKRPYIEKHKAYYKLYRSWLEKKLYTYDIFVPYTFAIVEDATAKILLALISEEELFNVKIPPHKFEGQAERLAYDIERILDFFIRHPHSEAFMELHEGIKSFCMYGFSANYIFPILNIDEEKNSSSLVRIVFDHIPFSNLYPDPYAKRFSRANWVIVRTEEYLNKIIEQKEKGVYDDFNPSELSQIYEDREWENMLKSMGILPNIETFFKPRERRIEVLDYISSDGHIITILGRAKVVRNTYKDGIKPYKDIPILGYKMPGPSNEMLGISFIEQLQPLQEQLNLIRSQRRENVALILNKILKVNPLGGVEFDTLFSAPGNIILTKDMDAIQEMNMIDTTQSAYIEEERLINDMEEVTGITRYFRGVTPRRKETATGILALQRMAQGRFDLVLKLVDHQLLKPLAYKIINYALQHLDEGLYDEICGENNAKKAFYSMQENDILQYVNFIPKTSAISQLKEVKREQFLRAFTMLANSPNINRLFLEKKLLEMFEVPDIESLLPQLNKMEGGAEIGSEIQEMMGNPMLMQMFMGGMRR